MVKLGMIGTGGYAYELLKRIWQLPDNMEIVGVASNPAWKADGLSGCLERGIPVYAEVDQLLDRVKGKADVMFVPTPIQTHFPLAKRCIEEGFDVWLEKPPVATIQEFDALAACSAQHNKVIAVMFQSLYSVIMQTMKKRIVSGEFGKIKRVDAMAGLPRLEDYFSRSDWAGQLKVNGDWVLDGTINNPLAHMLSNELYLATQKPNAMADPCLIEAELYQGHDISSEDTSSLRMWTTEGVEIMFHASLCSGTEMKPSIRVECEYATLEYSDFVRTVITYKGGRQEELYDDSDPRVSMLKRLAQGYRAGGVYDAALKLCRPFTKAVNGAFESCGRIHAVDREHIQIVKQGDSIRTVIDGIDHALRLAYNSRRLFSELDMAWAKKSERFFLDGYNQFPVRFQG